MEEMFEKTKECISKINLIFGKYGDNMSLEDVTYDEYCIMYSPMLRLAEAICYDLGSEWADQLADFISVINRGN